MNMELNLGHWFKMINPKKKHMWKIWRRLFVVVVCGWWWSTTTLWHLLNEWWWPMAVHTKTTTNHANRFSLYNSFSFSHFSFPYNTRKNLLHSFIIKLFFLLFLLLKLSPPKQQATIKIELSEWMKMNSASKCMNSIWIVFVWIEMLLLW